MNNEYFKRLSQSIKAYVKYTDNNGNDVFIRSDTDLQEIEYNDNLDRLIGCFNARSAKVKIMNPIKNGEYRYTLSDKELEIFIGYKDDSEVHYSKKGTFVLKKVDSETVGIQTQFELCDKSYVFDKICTLDFPYPCTRLQVVQIICEHLSIELATLNFWLSDEILTKVFYNPKSTYREIIRIIAESCCCFAKIGDDDRLYIKFFEPSNYKLIPRVYKKLNINECFGYVNRIVLCETDNSGSTDYDVIMAEDEEDIQENGLSEIKISNNLILNENREKYAPLFLEHLKDFKYYDFSTEMVLGNYLLDHVIIDLVDKEGYEKPSIIMNINFRYNGALKSNINSPAQNKLKQQYPGAGKVGEIIKDISLHVDHNTQVLEAQAKEISDSQEQIVQVTMDINNIKNLFQITGGNNLIKNSVGLFGNEYWSQSKTGTFSFGEDSDLKGKTTSASKITILNGTLTSLPTNIGGLTINTVKSFNFKIKQDEDTITTVTLYGLSESSPIYQKTFTEKMNWQDIYIEEECRFFVDNPDLTLKIESSSTYNGKVEISDLMLNEGEKQAWQPSSGEVFGAVIQMNYMGLSCRSLAQKTITLLDGQGWRTCHFNGSDIGETITKQTVDGTDTNNLNVKYKITQSSFVKDVIPYHNKPTLVLYQKGVI